MRRLAVFTVLAVLLLPLMLFLFGWWQFSKIDRVDVGDVLSPAGGGGTNYLIVGSDSRDGIDEDEVREPART